MIQISDTDEIQALYQRIMAELEPDLLIEQIPGLVRRYANESPENKVARQKRYAAAFAECFARIDAVLAQMKQDFRSFKGHILDLCRTKEQEGAPGVLQSLEDSLGAS